MRISKGIMPDKNKNNGVRAAETVIRKRGNVPLYSR